MDEIRIQKALGKHLFLQNVCIPNVLMYQKGLDICLGLLGHCDILVLCDGWEQSRGCKGEYEYAQKHGKAVFKLDEWKALNRI